MYRGGGRSECTDHERSCCLVVWSVVTRESSRRRASREEARSCSVLCHGEMDEQWISSQRSLVAAAGLAQGSGLVVRPHLLLGGGRTEKVRRSSWQLALCFEEPPIRRAIAVFRMATNCLKQTSTQVLLV